MVTKYRLGLDVGTASVGAAAVSLDKDGQPDGLIWHHVRIFSEPLENAQGTLVSKKAGRRKARMQRRQIDRRTSRCDALLTFPACSNSSEKRSLPMMAAPSLSACPSCD